MLDGTIRVPWESSRSRYTDLLLLNNSALTSTTCLSTLPFAHRCFPPSAIRGVQGWWKQGEQGIDGKTLVLSTRESYNRCTRRVFLENFLSPSLILLFFYNDLFFLSNPIRIIFLLFSSKQKENENVFEYLGIFLNFFPRRKSTLFFYSLG